ncbi:MAG: lipopolysaccharide kinase InaA family protein [Bacteroidales bacterium]
MKTTIVVNPKYESLRSFIADLPETFDNSGTVIYDARNQLREFTVEGLVIIVKRYKVPHIINQIIYSYFRESKSARAYHYAQKLLSLGFDTPEPVAYIETSCKGLFNYSYFVSLRSESNRLLREFGDFQIEGREHIAEALGNYMADLHNAGIVHEDFSPGNILFDEKDGKVSFTLIDINRMSFRNLNQEESIHSFRRLYGCDKFYEIVAKSYAKRRGFDPEYLSEKVVRIIHEFHNKKNESGIRKQNLKRLLNK